jgi:serine/threonine protein kinase
LLIYKVVTTPASPPIRHLRTFSDRFWAMARGPEGDDQPEPERSLGIVRHCLAVLDRVDNEQRWPGGLIGMLRQAELDGDLSYASPEQVRGESMDERSLVFSVGVVLFEKLTGRHPFGAENNRARRVERIRRGEMGSGVNHFPTVAAGLRSVMVRAMGPFPEERWADLKQMRERLAQFVEDEAPAPRLPGTAAEIGEPTRVVRRATDFGRELMQVVAKQEAPRPPGRAFASDQGDAVSGMVTLERRPHETVDVHADTVLADMSSGAPRVLQDEVSVEAAATAPRQRPRPTPPPPVPSRPAAPLVAAASRAPAASPAPAAKPASTLGLDPNFGPWSAPDPEPTALVDKGVSRSTLIIGVGGVLLGAAVATFAFVVAGGQSPPPAIATATESHAPAPSPSLSPSPSPAPSPSLSPSPSPTP